MNDPSANIPFEHKVRLIMLVDDDPPCGADRNAGLIRSAGQIARDLVEGLEHHGVIKLDRVGIGGPAECERADNAAGRLRHGSCYHDRGPRRSFAGAAQACAQR